MRDPKQATLLKAASRLRRSREASGTVLERHKPARHDAPACRSASSRGSSPTDEFQTVTAVAARIVPQPTSRPPIPVAALVDDKLHRGAVGWLSTRGNAARGRGVAARARGARRGGEAAFGAPFPRRCLTRDAGYSAGAHAKGRAEGRRVGQHAIG